MNVILRHQSSLPKQPRICIIGSGPAGFYTAQELLKLNPRVHVDIFEKQPVPFGLVRFGVAPDHADVKNIISTFTETANNPRCSFIGNVTVGRDISVSELKEHYTALILAHGAEEEKKLGIPGEDLTGVISAKNFVGWYNGRPEDKDLQVDLDADTAVIIGHGPVAMDIARILLTPVDVLAQTDITEYSLETLRKSRVRRVVLVGRRGPLHLCFTPRELREMLKLPDLRPNLHPEDYIDLDDEDIESLPRAQRLLVGLVKKHAESPSEEERDLWSAAGREWELRFRLSPLEILERDHKVSGVKFGINKLLGSDIASQIPLLTDLREEIPCSLVFRSIGYRSRQIDQDIPFDKVRGLVRNVKGRVSGQPKLYCSGWSGRPAVDVILSTMVDAHDVSKAVLQDLEDGKLEIVDGKAKALQILEERDVQIVTFSDWEQINEEEIFSGQKLGKPREKITDIQIFLDIVRANAKETDVSKYH